MGGQNYVNFREVQVLPAPPPPPSDLENYWVDFDAKKRHSTRRNVNFLKMPNILHFDQKAGIVAEQPRHFGYFFNGHCIHAFQPIFILAWPGGGEVNVPLANIRDN